MIQCPALNQHKYIYQDSWFANGSIVKASALLNSAGGSANDRLIKEKEAAIKELQKSVNKLSQEKLELLDKHPERYDEISDQNFNQYLQVVEQLPAEDKSHERSVAVWGRTNAGKSTLINALHEGHIDTRTGKPFVLVKVAPVVATVGYDAVYQKDNFVIHDVFGHNDEEAYTRLEFMAQAKRLHLIAVVYSTSAEDNLKLARLVKALGVDGVFIRNDTMDLSETEQAEVLGHDGAKFAGIDRSFRVVLVNAKKKIGLEPVREIFEQSHKRTLDMDDSRKRARVA